MKKIFKTAAVFLGFTTCIAGKCPLQNNADDIVASGNAYETDQSVENNSSEKNSRALAFIQDLDKIYYL